MSSHITHAQSPLHQGTRSRTGTQPEREFVARLLEITGDCRLLWLPDLTDTTTSSDRSRNAATITWSESLDAFDTPRTRLGSGVAVAFNGTDESGSAPDSDALSFGDGANDEPFSTVALLRPDNVVSWTDYINVFDQRGGSGQTREWRAMFDASGYPGVELYDETNNAAISVEKQTSLTAGTWTLLSTTYDGSGSATGLALYKDGARQTGITDISSGSYTAMSNQASTTLNIGFSKSTGGAHGNFLDGRIALVMLVAAQLSEHQMWTIKEACNAFFGLSL